MTDKQIIIDVCPYQGECSVSGCKRNDDGCFVKQLFEERNRAENQIVDLNKMVEAKEQECKELRIERKNLKWDLENNIQVKKHAMEEINQLKAEVKSKAKYIQEQRDIINQYSKEIEMYKKCQGKRASKREEELKAENVELKKWKETVVELFERTCRCKYLNEENNHCGFYNRKCIGRLNQCLYKNQQALTEIKEIVETCCKIADCKKCNFFAICENNCVDVILQKISEVEE